MKIRTYKAVKYPVLGWCIKYDVLDENTGETKSSTDYHAVAGLPNKAIAQKVAQALNEQTISCLNENNKE